MKVEVRLFATFRYNRNKKEILDVNDETRVKEIVQYLNIDESEIAILLVNGRDGDIEQKLYDGDTISLFPPVGGG